MFWDHGLQPWCLRGVLFLCFIVWDNHAFSASGMPQFRGAALAFRIIPSQGQQATLGSSASNFVFNIVHDDI